MSSFLQDLRFALRLLAKSPGFAIVAVLTLAVGIGANTVVFNWIEGMLVEPLPQVPQQERLRVLTGRARDGGLRSLSVPDMRDLAALKGPLAATGFGLNSVNLTGGARPERIWASLVSGNFFDVLQVRPLLGRGLAARGGLAAAFAVTRFLSSQLPSETDSTPGRAATRCSSSR